MVTLILGKTLVFWSGITAGIFFIGGLFVGTIVNKSKKLDIEKKKRIRKYIFRLSIIFILIHVSLALLSSLFKIWL
mgnify:CR=1 FL=1